MAETLDIIKLQSQGVRQLRGVGFVFDIARRKVLLQRTLWPPYEGGTGSSDRTYVLVGITGLLPLAGGPGLNAAMSRVILQTTTLVVPAEKWRLVMVGDPMRWQPTGPIPEHYIPLIAMAAAVDSLDGAVAQVGDCVGAVGIDGVVTGYGDDAQALLFGVPEMIARGFEAVQGA